MSKTITPLYTQVPKIIYFHDLINLNKLNLNDLIINTLTILNPSPPSLNYSNILA